MPSGIGAKKKKIGAISSLIMGGRIHYYLPPQDQDQMDSRRCRGWCFTINNHTEDDHQAVAACSEPAQYLIVAREVGESGTPHLQGYVYFKTLKSLKQVSALLPRAHLERQRGTFDEAIAYCKKDGDFQEVGDPPMSRSEQGKRGRDFWDEQLSLAKKGRVDEVDSKLQITHDLALHRIAARSAVAPPDLEFSDKTHKWYYGPTRTGKSTQARVDFPNFYYKLANKWWCGYQNEEVVLIEDFDKTHSVLGHHLKIWADRFAFRAEIKGGSIYIRPKVIVVTSNYHPNEIFFDSGILNPILERFEVVHFPSAATR